MGQKDDSSGSIPAQSGRRNLFLDKWENSLQENKQVLVIGDVNLDFLKWNRTNLPQNDSSSKVKSLKNAL